MSYSASDTSTRLHAPKRGLRAVVAPVIFVSLMVYFIYHLFQGERGIFSMLRLQTVLAADEQKLAELQGKKEVLEHQVTLLRPDSLDLDMLEERVRIVLHFAQPDEMLINVASLSQNPSPSA
jgi:cell division protein FtsB